MQKIDRLQVRRLSYEEMEGGPIVAKTTNYTAVAADSGKLLVGEKAGGTWTLTLPAVAIGKDCVFRAIQTQAENFVIVAPSDTLVCKNNAAADLVKFETSTELIGASCMILCDGTKYYFFNTSGCKDSDGAEV